LSSIAQVISNCLYLFVGFVSLAMAWKNIFARRFLPFHEAASGKNWETLDEGIQTVMLTLLRVSGLGFLIVGCLLVILPFLNRYDPSPLAKSAMPALASLYCFGLFLINYQLHVKTKAQTPWKRSLFAAAVILVAIAVSYAE
jgi:hypothetical protein